MSTLQLTDDFGLNAELGALEELWGDGKMAVVQGVGYPDHNLSHFRSTDIVATADTESGTTGWMGRGLLEEFPDYETNPPPAPPAVQNGASVPVLYQAASTSQAKTLDNARAVERVATERSSSRRMKREHRPMRLTTARSSRFRRRSQPRHGLSKDASARASTSSRWTASTRSRVRPTCTRSCCGRSAKRSTLS